MLFVIYSLYVIVKAGGKPLHSFLKRTVGSGPRPWLEGGRHGGDRRAGLSQSGGRGRTAGLKVRVWSCKACVRVHFWARTVGKGSITHYKLLVRSCTVSWGKYLNQPPKQACRLTFDTLRVRAECPEAERNCRREWRISERLVLRGYWLQDGARNGLEKALKGPFRARFRPSIIVKSHELALA